MFKKFLSIAMIFAIMASNAQEATSLTLKELFDNLNYSLNVEWDQKDKAFYDAQIQKFTAEVKKLQSSGLSNQDLVEFAKSQVKNEKVAANIESALNLVQINKMKPEEARKFALESVSKSYSTGANYSSSGYYTIAAIVLVVALVAVVIAAGGNTTGGGYCDSDVYVCDDYYDSWGYYLYSDCYYTTYCY